MFVIYTFFSAILKDMSVLENGSYLFWLNYRANLLHPKETNKNDRIYVNPQRDTILSWSNSAIYVLSGFHSGI